MGSPGTRRARRRHMLELRRAKNATEPAQVVEEAVVEEPAVVEAAEPAEPAAEPAEPAAAKAEEAPKEGLLKKALGRGRRKRSKKKSEE